MVSETTDRLLTLLLTCAIVAAILGCLFLAYQRDLCQVKAKINAAFSLLSQAISKRRHRRHSQVKSQMVSSLDLHKVVA